MGRSVTFATINELNFKINLLIMLFLTTVCFPNYLGLTNFPSHDIKKKTEVALRSAEADITCSKFIEITNTKSR